MFKYIVFGGIVGLFTPLTIFGGIFIGFLFWVFFGRN